MTDINDIVARARADGRTIRSANGEEPTLGPLRHLPGVWANTPNLPGHGWNMIALPFATDPSGGLNYRLLLNQYNETLEFKQLDAFVPNRGIAGPRDAAVEADQTLVAIDYEQTIRQIAADDFPKSDVTGGPGAPIHHEPGFFLHIVDRRTADFNIARQATIPHGNSVLALGRGDEAARPGPPAVPVINGLPIGVTPDIQNNPYLAPYRHFNANPFQGVFDPTAPNALLNRANQGAAIIRTTTLEFDTTFATGGIVNTPFVVDQADAVSMKSTFWIQELEGEGPSGGPNLRLQYSQVVMLDFFGRRDGAPGRIAWPHISINTLQKVADTAEDFCPELEGN